MSSVLISRVIFVIRGTPVQMYEVVAASHYVCMDPIHSTLLSSVCSSTCCVVNYTALYTIGTCITSTQWYIDCRQWVSLGLVYKGSMCIVFCKYLRSGPSSPVH